MLGISGISEQVGLFIYLFMKIVSILACKEVLRQRT